MMKKMKSISMIALIAILVASCGTSNNVVNKHSVSKRKYTKGLFLKKKSNLKSTTGDVNENIASSEVKNKKLKSSELNLSVNELMLTELAVASNQYEIANTQTSSDLLIVSMQDDFQNRSSDIMQNDDELIYLENHSKLSEQGFSQMSEAEMNRSILQKSDESGEIGNSDLELILLVILAIIIPPLAVFLFEGVTTRFWIDLILAILGYGIGFGVLGFGWWLLGLIAVIYALLIVLEAI